mgnify:CR=1 FL=1|tara:strand:- start:4302 stop:5540 length:1239 start_codon:yes stop_codon:yes gene_type:complete
MVYLNQIDVCEVCKNKKLIPVLNLGKLPLCDDLIPVNQNETCAEYETEILFCNECFTAHQKYQVEKKYLFPKTYHYRARFTKDVVDGMHELVNHCKLNLRSLKGMKVLDIGCNDGTLLDIFRNEECETFGIEPTGASEDALGKGHTIYNEFFDKESSKAFLSKHGYPDIITFTNVFAHIEDLDSLLVALKYLLSERTIIVIENHYLGSILSSNQFDTFYHEHPRSYSYASFKQIAKNLGHKVLDVSFPPRYGGNIRIFIGNMDQESKVEESLEKKLLITEASFKDQFMSMAKKISVWKEKKKIKIAQLIKEYEYIFAKAFPGRAAILIRILDIDETVVKAVFEKKGSKKIGHYVPGTRIPICEDEELFLLSDKNIPILNLAWHIPNEIKSYLVENNVNSELINIIDPVDFDN